MSTATPSTYKQRWAGILSIAWPLVIANSFWNLQLTIDRVFLGQFSTEALGAAMAVMGVFWTPMALLQQTASYVTTFVAQYFGAKNEKMIGPSVWQSIYLSIAGGVAFSFLWVASPWLFNAIGHSSKMIALEIEYFDAVIHSALPTALVAAASGFFTGLGNTRIVMGINAVGLVFNVLFDYLFIFGNWGLPAMGMKGAGYATTLANWAAAIYGFWLVFRDKKHALYQLRTGWRWNFDLLKRFLKFGLPSGLQWALEGLAVTVFLIIMGHMKNGEAALASSSIAVTMMMLSVLPALGIAQAVMVQVGQHLGEDDPSAAEKATWAGVQVSAMYLVVMSMAFVIFPGFFLSWFENKQDPDIWREVSYLVPFLLMFVAAFTTVDSMNLNFSFALKGAGDTKFVSLVALIVPWPVMVMPTYLMRNWEGAVLWGWGAGTIYAIVIAAIFWRRFVGGKWKQMSVIK